MHDQHARVGMLTVVDNIVRGVILAIALQL
jgi:hypothetical protein